MPLPLSPLHAQPHTAHRAESDHRIADAPRPIALWHLASFDAPTVAIAWALGFARAADADLGTPVLLALGLATWSIYITDRLLDARAGFLTAALGGLRERHYFHWRHRRLLAPMALIAACSAMYVALTSLSSGALECGMLLAAASAVYFYFVHRRRPKAQTRTFFPAGAISKELLAALLITAGCVLPSRPYFHDTATLNSAIWLFWTPCLYLAALMWLNCWCITVWESSPAELGPWRAAAIRPERSAPVLAVAALVASCGMLLAFLVPAADPRSAALLAAGSASALLLALLDRLRFRMTPLALRAAADLVMLTPLFLFLR